MTDVIGFFMMAIFTTFEELLQILQIKKRLKLIESVPEQPIVCLTGRGMLVHWIEDP